LSTYSYRDPGLLFRHAVPRHSSGHPDAAEKSGVPRCRRSNRPGGGRSSDAWTSFALERNRRYQNSPELTFRYERLQRQVSLRQQVFISLSESLKEETAEEVRGLWRRVRGKVG